MNDYVKEMTDQAEVFDTSGHQLSKRLLEWRNRMMGMEDEITRLRQEDILKAKAIAELEDTVNMLTQQEMQEDENYINAIEDEFALDPFPVLDAQMQACCDYIDELLEEDDSDMPSLPEEVSMSEEDYVPMSSGLTDDEFYTLMDATVMNLPIDIILVVVDDGQED